MGDLPRVIGRYEVVSRLGQGGMGSLYLAKDPKIGRLVAIKLVRQEFDSPEARQRFAREAQSAGTLRHPHIVTIFDVDEHESLPFIAMEYVEGETLSEIIRRKAPYAVPARLQWIEELCGGLAYAHKRGVVHRDVKPANLMLDNEGSLKILDFGLARREASKFTQTQAIIGTPNYMSPEQIRAGDVGPRSDQFAVGVVLYEVLTYKEAFPGTVHQAMHKILYEEPRPLRELLPNAAPALERILARALDKDPAHRYEDLSAMRLELAAARQLVAGQRIDSGPTMDVSDAMATRRLPSNPHSSEPSGPGPTPHSGGSKRIFDPAHRLSLQKKRAAQIEAHLADARRHSEIAAFDKARESVDHALVIDPEHPGALQLIDDIAAEELAFLIASARKDVQQGRIEAAEQVLGQAMDMAPHSPDVLSLRDTVEAARREIERTRQVQDLLRRARARFSEGSFEGAIRAVGEVLAIDPGNAAARDLQARASEAIEGRSARPERESAAQSAVSRARALVEKGERDAAIAELEAFRPPHDLVTALLASLRAGAVRAKTEADARVAAPAPSAVPARPPDARSRTPMYAAAALALIAVAAIGAYILGVFGGDDTPPQSAASPAAPAPAAAPSTSTSVAPATAAPPPAVVTPPASLANQAPQNQNDRDAMEAYKLLAAGQHAEAAKVVARIAKRDPKSDLLRDLRAQIQTVADAGRQRERAAAAATPPASVTTPGNPPPSQPSGPPPSAGAPPTSPGAAASNPPPKPEVTAPAAAPVTAAPVPAPAPAAPAPSPAEVERPAIEASIQEYAKAVTSKDIAAVGRVRKYTPAEARNWDRIFRNFAEYRLFLKVAAAPVVDGDRATVLVEEQTSQTEKKGGIQVFGVTRRTEYKLEKIGGKWMILPPG